MLYRSVGLMCVLVSGHPDEPLEFHERFVVEDDVLHVLERHPTGLETIFNGPGGKAGVVLFPGEALQPD